ncbi:MAG: hypothetical protein KAK00_08830 [Nanoarchaeota archaeon]|nr:hypothetical protein [Nanoarchaeota archaeon]
MKIKLYVSLKIPDTTAITAFHTLERLGYSKLAELEREDYYEFTVLKDEDKFMEDIVKVDVLVNANKHNHRIFKAENVPKEEDDKIIDVLIKNSDDKCSSLFSTLRERMGFIHINEISKGILWKMHFREKENAKELAEKITKDLLYNEHYQEYKIL